MYSITISHKIICLAAKYSNKEFISSAVILCFEDGPTTINNTETQERLLTYH
jgi:hypothetical protein